ncbi:MAG: glycine/sarcosine/betaine reductase selenoprotein B family protein [Bacillota bacterium]
MSSKLEKFVNNFPWVENEVAPWTELQKPLQESKVALISTGGLYLQGDEPFQIKDREDVDESFREIPLNASLDELKIAHEHYEKRYAEQDINTVFPVERLKQLVQEDFIGSLAEVNFSISGYIPEPDKLYDTAQQIAQKLKEMGVDAAFIVPV